MDYLNFILYTKPRQSLRYGLGFVLLLSLLLTISWSERLLSLGQSLTKLPAAIQKFYPEELVIEIKQGKASVNMEQPLILTVTAPADILEVLGYEVAKVTRDDLPMLPDSSSMDDFEQGINEYLQMQFPDRSVPPLNMEKTLAEIYPPALLDFSKHHVFSPSELVNYHLAKHQIKVDLPILAIDINALPEDYRDYDAEWLLTQSELTHVDKNGHPKSILLNTFDDQTITAERVNEFANRLKYMIEFLPESSITFWMYFSVLIFILGLTYLLLISLLLFPLFRYVRPGVGFHQTFALCLYSFTMTLAVFFICRFFGFSALSFYGYYQPFLICGLGLTVLLQNEPILFTNRGKISS